MSTIGILILIVWCIAGAITTISIIDDREMDSFLPNENKRRFAVILFGPFSWVCFTCRFVWKTVEPTIKKIIEWFYEE